MRRVPALTILLALAACQAAPEPNDDDDFIGGEWSEGLPDVGDAPTEMPDFGDGAEEPPAAASTCAAATDEGDDGDVDRRRILAQDDAGRPLRAETTDASGAVLSTEVWRYAENGWLHEIDLGDDGSVDANKLHVVRGDGWVEEWDRVAGEDARRVFVWDDAGRLRLTRAEEAGAVTFEQRWDYDDAGRLIHRVANDGVTRSWRWSYDDEGRLVGYEEIVADIVVDRREWSYDERGLPSVEVSASGCAVAECAMTTITRYAFDDAGRVIASESDDLGTPASPDASSTFVWPEDGASGDAVRTHRDSNNKIVLKEAWVFEDPGRLSEYLAVDPDGPDHNVRWAYDAMSRLSYVESTAERGPNEQAWTFGADGRLLEYLWRRGDDTRLFAYDDDGNLVARSRSDAWSTETSRTTYTGDCACQVEREDAMMLYGAFHPTTPCDEGATRGFHGNPPNRPAGLPATYE